MAFLEAVFFLFRHRQTDQFMADSLSAVLRCNGHMVNVSPASIVAAKEDADEMPIRFTHEALPGIVRQVSGDVVACVGIAQADAGETFPQRVTLVIIGEGHGVVGVFHYAISSGQGGRGLGFPILGRS